MNIAMVSNEFPPGIGGIQTHVYELSRELVKQGHQVDVLTRRKSKDWPAYEKYEKVCVRRIPLAKNHFIYDLQLGLRLKQLIREKHIDLIHVHGMRPLSACGRLNLPVVFTNHTSSFLKRVEKGEKHRRKMKSQLLAASLVIAPSQVLVEKTLELGHEGKVEFIPNGVDVDKFSPGASCLRAKLNIPADDFVVLFAGRLHKVKGVDILAEAMSFLRCPRLHFVVAGDGDLRMAVHEIASKALGDANIHFLGSVENSEMVDIYRSADILVLPSLMEATSIAGLEAMACGLPVVGSRVGGLPVIIDEGVSGILVEPKSPKLLAQAIQSLYDDREILDDMGSCSRSRAVSMFSWRVVAMKTCKCYQAAMK